VSIHAHCDTKSRDARFARELLACDLIGGCWRLSMRRHIACWFDGPRGSAEGPRVRDRLLAQAIPAAGVVLILALGFWLQWSP
jgi:hypothetical protein